MKYNYEWHYDDHPDLSGDKILVYYNPFYSGTCNILAKKSWFDNPENDTTYYNYEEILTKIKDIIETRGKLFYSYMPQDPVEYTYYYDKEHGYVTEVQSIDEAFDEDFDGSCENGLEERYNDMWDEAIKYIKNELMCIPKDVNDMYISIRYARSCDEDDD